MTKNSRKLGVGNILASKILAYYLEQFEDVWKDIIGKVMWILIKMAALQIKQYRNDAIQPLKCHIYPWNWATKWQFTRVFVKFPVLKFEVFFFKIYFYSTNFAMLLPGILDELS